MLQGKLIYFSPEYLRGLPVNRTLDVYAMGVTLWSALAGALPWPGRDEPQLLHAILIEGIPPLSSAALAPDPSFDELIATACRADPRGRFQTAREMHDALESLAKRTSGIASYVQVAEYVERVMGSELAARRDKMRARRIVLEAVTSTLPAPCGVDSQQVTESMLAPVSIEDAFNPVEASTGYAERAASRRSRRPQQLFYAGVLLVILVAGYAALARYSGAGPSEGPSATRRAAPQGQAAAPRQPSESTAEVVSGREPGEAAVGPEAVEVRPPSPVVDVEQPKPRERKKPRREVGISTKNPYRKADP
jgi:hypothetical protein